MAWVQEVPSDRMRVVGHHLINLRKALYAGFAKKHREGSLFSFCSAHGGVKISLETRDGTPIPADLVEQCVQEAAAHADMSRHSTHRKNGHSNPAPTAVDLEEEEISTPAAVDDSPPLITTDAGSGSEGLPPPVPMTGVKRRRVATIATPPSSSAGTPARRSSSRARSGSPDRP